MLAALIALGLVWLAPQDAFVAQRDVAAALDPRSPRFTIAMDGDRRTFRIGERIPLVFTYDNISNRSGLGDGPYTHFAAAVLDRREGTGDPLDDYARALIYVPAGVSGCVEGGVVGGAPPPKPPPLNMTFLLNEGVRFDTPGHYRLYVMDRHDAESDDSMGRPQRPPLVSNIVEIDITARDSAWEEGSAVEAIAVLASSTDAEVRTDAVRTLSFLGTDRAVDEMVLGLSRWWSEHAESREDDSQYVRGLFAARDRWSGRKTLLYEERLKRSWDATLSENLVEALFSAVAWRLDDADYRRLEALCLSTCQDDILRRRQDATEAEVVAFGLASPARPPRYIVDGLRLQSQVQLHTKLLQFPRGTSVRWYAGDSAGGTGWEPDGQDREFARVDRFLRAHGMSLRRR